MRQRYGKNRKVEGHRHCGERWNRRLNRVENQAMLVAALPPKATVMSGCTLPQRPMYDCMVLLWPGSVLMSMACVDTEGLWSVIQCHADISGQCCTKGYATSGDHIDVSGLHCHLRLGWCPWSRLNSRALSGSMDLLPLEAMFVVCAVARNHEEVRDVCSHWWQRARRQLLKWFPCTAEKARDVEGFCNNALLLP